jgi:hypothetical protein
MSISASVSGIYAALNSTLSEIEDTSKVIHKQKIYQSNFYTLLPF